MDERNSAGELLEGTLLWAWKCCRYSRIIVVISAVVISEVDCRSSENLPKIMRQAWLCKLKLVLCKFL